MEKYFDDVLFYSFSRTMQPLWSPALVSTTASFLLLRLLAFSPFYCAHAHFLCFLRFFFYSFTLKRLPCSAFIRKHFIYIFLRLHASDRVEAMALFRIWLLVITILVVVAYKINSLGKLNSWPFLCYNKHIIKRPLVCRAGTISFKAFEYLALRKFQRFPYYFIF